MPLEDKIVLTRFPFSGEWAGKYFYISYTFSGECAGAAISMFEIALADDGSGTWGVTGKGAMARLDPVVSYNTSESSPFYAKTVAHEKKHYDDWQVKDDQNKYLYRNVDTFYDRVKDLEGTSRFNLLSKVVTNYNEWGETDHPGPGKTGQLWMELRAYAAEYTVAPVGVLELSEKRIRDDYNNDE